MDDDLVEARCLHRKPVAEQVDLLGAHEGLKAGIVSSGSDEGHLKWVREVVRASADESELVEQVVLRAAGHDAPAVDERHAVSYTHLTLPTNREV